MKGMLNKVAGQTPTQVFILACVVFAIVIEYSVLPQPSSTIHERDVAGKD